MRLFFFISPFLETIQVLLKQIFDNFGFSPSEIMKYQFYWTLQTLPHAIIIINSILSKYIARQRNNLSLWRLIIKNAERELDINITRRILNKIILRINKSTWCYLVREIRDATKINGNGRQLEAEWQLACDWEERVAAQARWKRGPTWSIAPRDH